jgi:hypothetical protein
MASRKLKTSQMISSGSCKNRDRVHDCLGFLVELLVATGIFFSAIYLQFLLA